MSHEIAAGGVRLVYSMPAWPSDILRSVQFTHFFESHDGVPFLVQTRDGWSWSSSERAPAFTVTFSSRESLDAVINGSSEDALARAFLEGDLDIQGDIFTLLNVAEYILRHSHGISRNVIRTLAQASIGWFKRLSASAEDTLSGGGRRASCSLNLPASFFRPWLGESLGSCCAAFTSPRDGLDTAQMRRLDHVCEALELSSDDRLLDANCGWGSLLLFAGKHGVCAKGIAAAEHQACIATDRIMRHNLHDRCHAVWGAVRHPQGVPGSYDKIVDIGAFDQVMHSHLADFLTRMQKLLVPGGRLLLHRLTRTRPLPRFSTGSQHAEVASANDLTSLAAELQCAESVGLHTLQVTDLGEQYRRTLRAWIDNLQHSSSPCHTCQEYRDYRSWLFCLLDTVSNLETGILQFHELVLVRPADAPTN